MTVSDQAHTALVAAAPEAQRSGHADAAKTQPPRWPRLSALGKLANTTAFKLTLVYLVVFALFAAFLNAAFDFCLGCQVYLFIQRNLRVWPAA